jgi:hypothetical protein
VLYYNCSKGGRTSQGSKKTLKKLKKGLDKPTNLWYNKNVPRERNWKGSQKKLKKVLKKVLTNRSTYGII